MPVRLAERAPETYDYPLLIRHLLHTPLAIAPEQEIVYRDQSRYTYRDFASRLHRVAGMLEVLGVRAGETVAVLDWDSHRYLECFFAIPMMGAVLQTVNVRLAPAQIAYTLRHAGPRVVLAHREFLPLLAQLRAQLPAIEHVVLLADGGTADPGPLARDCAGEYEQLLAAAPPHFDFQDFDERALATTFYTTGTTGNPKGVCFSHRQIVLHTLAVLGTAAGAPHGQAFRFGDVYMPLTPMFHVHAWGNPYVATLLGVKQVYPGRYVPEELIALRTRERATFSHCVPTILNMVLDAGERMHADLSGWKLVIGGSAMPAGLARRALAAGMDVYGGYGMSETCPALTLSRFLQSPDTLSEEAQVERRCRAGLPVPLVERRIVDAAMQDVPHDDAAVGEVVVRAPWLTPCYVGDPQASAELWRGGYLHTQDVGRIDPAGYLRITDRCKDVIKTGGEWVSSLELEDLISRHPGVAEVAVIAVPDACWGERPHVLLVRRPQAPGTKPVEAGEICALIAAAAECGTLPRYAIPERVTFVEALEHTSVGKINKRALRERYA